MWTQSLPSVEYYLSDNNLYNNDIPTPESILGYQVGEWHVTHDKLVDYMKTIAQTSNRIKIENRGYTFEDRPLLLLTITSTKNHQNIEAIRKEHLLATQHDMNSDYKKRPVVVYQGFSIHGNEASGSNAALLLAYHLAAAETESVKNLLENTIILFDPSMNPDGLQRFAHWANSNKNLNLNPDSNDREYHEDWPGGRTNHYWFDMNRDWLPVQLPESQARIKTFHRWMPNILTDHHEMGTNSSFFFQPGIPSRTHPLTPVLNQQITKEIGQFHASAFNNLGSLYYSEEDFDDFYYGKGSTFPDINGSIGILFEQGSSRGHIQETDNGILSFPFTIRNQLTAALSTLEAALNMREKLLKYQYNFFENARKESAKEAGDAYVFGDVSDPAKAYHLAELLNRQHIEVYPLKEDIEIDGTFFSKSTAYTIPKQQKNSRLLKAMFETRTEFKDSLFYDISAWSFSHAFDLDFSENGKIKYVDNKTKVSPPTGKLNQKSDYAYVMPWSDYYSPKALYHLMQNNIRVKVGLQPFAVDGIDFDYGSILIPVQNQIYSAERLAQILEQTAKSSYLNIYGVTTGLANGPDLGSNQFRTLKKPTVGMIVGNDIDAYDAGEIWHLMDTRYNIPITRLGVSNLIRFDLNRYNCIILPNTYGLDEALAKKLKKWVENGGTLIAYQNALSWLKKHELLTVEFAKQSRKAKNVSFEQRSKYQGAQGIGGAIFEAYLDRSHPINFGYNNNKLALFRNTTIFMKPDKNSYNNPIKYSKDPLLSGYISEDNLKLLKESSAFKSSALGNGKVIGFTDNTNFRAFWYGTNKLLMNALFFRTVF